MKNDSSVSGANDVAAVESKRTRLALDLIHQHADSESTEISVLLQAMRKMREAVVSSGRIDVFARTSYLFIIRATILLGHMESYHPALLYVHGSIHPEVALSDDDLHEVLSYRVLDTACRRADLNAAHEMQTVYNFHDAKVESIVKSIAHGNWTRFWKLRSFLTTMQARVADFACERMRKHALDCLGRSYLSIDKDSVEKILRKSWDAVARDYASHWTLNEDTVVIRQTKRK